MDCFDVDTFEQDETISSGRVKHFALESLFGLLGLVVVGMTVGIVKQFSYILCGSFPVF